LDALFGPERADAEKDAALTDDDLDKLFFWMVKHHRDGHLRGFKEFARAILAAKEKKS
jgi:rubrerythrin